MGQPGAHSRHSEPPNSRVIKVGAKIAISVDNGPVHITDAKGRQAKVVKADIAATNGVIHVIDAVLLPAG